MPKQQFPLKQAREEEEEGGSKLPAVSCSRYRKSRGRVATEVEMMPMKPPRLHQNVIRGGMDDEPADRQV